MSKRNNDKWQRDQLLVTALKTRAEERALNYGHQLRKWKQAKAKFGDGAWKSICDRCNEDVMVLPHGSKQVPERSVSRTNPSITGNAVFRLCSKAKV